MPRVPKSVAYYCLFIFLLAAASGVFLQWKAGGSDDAFIAYRYARNIADGYGFVWNPGEKPVYGATSVLYIYVLAIAALLGFPIPQASIAIGVLCRALASVFIFLLGRKVHSTLAGVCASLLFAISYSTILWSPGLETQFYILLIILAFYLYELDRLNWCAVVCALIGMTRLDGFMVPLVLGLHYLWVQRHQIRALQRRILHASATFFAVLLPWVIFCLYEFGTIFPASLYAKRSHGEGISGAFSLRLLPDWFESPIVFGILAALGAWGLVRLFSVAPRRKFIAAILWVPLYYAEYSLANLPNFAWYYTPPFFMVFLLASVGFAELLPTDLAHRKSFRDIGKLLLVTALLGTVFVVPANQTYEIIRRDPLGKSFLQNDDRYRLAAWLLRQGVQPTQTLLAYEVGQLGYYTNMKVLDSLGLVSPELVPHLWQKDYLWSVLHYQPDYVILVDIPRYPATWSVYRSVWFQHNYREVFRLHGCHRGRGYNKLIYRKIAPSPPTPTEVQALYRMLAESEGKVDDVSRQQWNLSNSQTWKLTHHLRLGESPSPKVFLRVESTGVDPFMHTAMNLDPLSVEGLEITMRVKPRQGGIRRAAELFWMAEKSPKYSEDKHVVFDIQPDGKFHTYKILLRNRLGWLTNGRVTFLRFDPAVFAAEIDIREIRLLPNTNLPPLPQWYVRLVE